MFGENLTVEGVDVSGAVIGERWRIGTVELEVVPAAAPVLQARPAVRRPEDAQALRARRTGPGAYLRIVAEGEVGAGDAVEVSDRPAHGVTIAQVAAAIMLDEGGLAAAAAAPGCPESLSRWMLERAA